MSTNGHTKFATSEWIKLIVALFAQAMFVFSAVMYWANRIVIAETKIASIEASQAEMRADIKQILKQTTQQP